MADMRVYVVYADIVHVEVVDVWERKEFEAVRSKYPGSFFWSTRFGGWALYSASSESWRNISSSQVPELVRLARMIE